jgi:hypothetical protein
MMVSMSMGKSTCELDASGEITRPIFSYSSSCLAMVLSTDCRFCRCERLGNMTPTSIVYLIVNAVPLCMTYLSGTSIMLHLNSPQTRIRFW